MKIRTLLPGSLRRMLRNGLDRCFQRKDLGLIKLGSTCTWTVLQSRLTPGANILSGGAGHDISFEINLVDEFGCNVAVFDPSPTGLETFTKVKDRSAGLAFHMLGFSGESKKVKFAAPSDAIEGSYRKPEGQDFTLEFSCVSPREAMRIAGFDNVELLKIDIEGFEYEFLDEMLKQGIRPPQIAVEFHHFLPNISIIRTWRVILKLQRAGYMIAHKTQCDYLFLLRTII